MNKSKYTYRRLHGVDREHLYGWIHSAINRGWIVGTPYKEDGKWYADMWGKDNAIEPPRYYEWNGKSYVHVDVKPQHFDEELFEI